MKTFAACVLFAAAPCFAADPIAKSTLMSRASLLEGEIASLMEHAGETADAGTNAQIDLRIVARWMASRAAESGEGDFAACADLRARGLLTAADLLGARLRKAAVSPAEAEALKRLHEMTYKLADLRGVGQLDDTCRNVAASLIPFAGALGTDVKALPPMRPQPMEEARDPQGRVPRTLGELAAKGKELSVSQPLRKQLLALANLASGAASDPNRQAEAAGLYSMLADVTDLAEGLQSNTAVDPDARNRTEWELTQALLLFNDVRTRQAGQARIDALGKYRDTVGRVQRLHLPADLQQQLMPAFVWAREHGEAGQRALGTIETYAQLCTRLDSRRGDVTLPPNETKARQELMSALETARTAFVSDASHLGDGMRSVKPEALQKHIGSMRRWLEAVDSIESLPAAMKLFTTSYRPKPFGGLEKRVAGAVAASAPSTQPSGNSGYGARESSDPFLQNLVQLYRLANELEHPTTGKLDAEVVRQYTDGRLAEFDEARRGKIAEQLDSAAGGREISGQMLAELESARGLMEVLKSGGQLESAIRGGDPLRRWVDWQLAPAQIRAVLAPYREATAAAFAGYTEGKSVPMARWAASRNRFGPIIALLTRVSAYSTQCADLPADLPGAIAMLATPMEGQPFANERWASFLIGASASLGRSRDFRGADGAIDALTARLGGK